MALISRISRLFRADFHAVLDRIEEPALLLRQAVREMEEDLDRDRRRRQSLDAELTRLEARRSELATRLAGTAEELDLCLDNGNEALARTLLRRRLETQAYQRLLAERRGELDEAARTLAGRIEENARRLEGMRQKAAILAAQDDRREVDDWTDSASTQGLAVSDDDVELALLRERQRRVTS